MTCLPNKEGSSSNELPSWLTDLDPNLYLNKNYLVLDFETSNLDKGDPRNPDNKIVLAVWEYRGERKVRWANEFGLDELVTACEQCDFIVAHNAQFELGWLARCGYDLSLKPVFCTQIAEYVIAGNRKWGHMSSLDQCLARRGYPQKETVVSRMIKGGTCPSEIHRPWLEEYCIKDVAYDHMLFKSQLATLQRNGLLAVMFCRCMLTPVLADIKNNGMHLDEDKVSVLFNEMAVDLRQKEMEFEEFTGGVNVKSTKQMREYLFETLNFQPPLDYRKRPMLTPGGDIQTGSAAMLALKPKNKKQRAFIGMQKELVKLRDSMSKYIRHFKRCIDENDSHVLFANFNQTRTDTHRLSSTGAYGFSVQFQNIDRRYKPVINSRVPTWKISEHDYAQLEYRCAVDMGADENGLEDIVEGVDAHGYTASIVYEADWNKAGEENDSKLEKEIRTKAKADTFKPLYGGSSGTKAQQTYYEAFKQKHKGIVSWQEENIQTALSKGKFTIPSGLIFYFGGTRITDTGYITNTANICNYPVQSFATADIVPIGVTFFWHRIRAAGLKSFIVNTVHDSVIGEVHPDEIEEYDAIAKKAMEEDTLRVLKKLYNYEFTTPLEVEGEFFDNWGE